MSDACTLRYAAATDVGPVRPINEDSVYAGPVLIAVADGVGGAAAGEVASELAISAMVPLADAAVDDPVAALRSAVADANARIRAAVVDDPDRTGMGTTLTALLLSGDTLGLAHAGDSRAYRLRDGELTQLTRDDTYVQWLIEEGCITPEEAGTHPHRSVVTRVLQGEPVDATYQRFHAVPGDRYLVCSDGLPGPVSAGAIAAALQAEPDVSACATALVRLALASGATDNVTVAIADVVPAPSVPTGEAAGTDASAPQTAAQAVPQAAADEAAVDSAGASEAPARAAGQAPAAAKLDLRVLALGALLLVALAFLLRRRESVRASS